MKFNYKWGKYHITTSCKQNNPKTEPSHPLYAIINVMVKIQIPKLFHFPPKSKIITVQHLIVAIRKYLANKFFLR